MTTDHRQRRHTLWLLCALSFILYVDRVNLATAAGAIKSELGLSNTELGVAFSAFAYSYAVCQVFGGWIAVQVFGHGDREAGTTVNIRKAVFKRNHFHG